MGPCEPWQQGSIEARPAAEAREGNREPIKPMKKPRKQSDEPESWAVYLMRAKGTYLGHVEARNEAEAIDKAVKVFSVRESERCRLSVRRE
jgi:hypothetical protein